MKPRMENANSAIELYSSVSTLRFCITLAGPSQFQGRGSLLQERSPANRTFVAEKRFTVAILIPARLVAVEAVSAPDATRSVPKNLECAFPHPHACRPLSERGALRPACLSSVYT
jgi:hypothetical protein